MSRYPLLLSTGTSQQKHQDLTRRRWRCFGEVGATVLSSPQGRGHPAASPNTAIPLPAGSWCSEAMNPPDLWYSCEFSTWWAQRLDQGDREAEGSRGEPRVLALCSHPTAHFCAAQQERSDLLCKFSPNSMALKEQKASNSHINHRFLKVYFSLLDAAFTCWRKGIFVLC